MSQNFKIGDRIIGPGKPCMIVAEVAQGHDGSLGIAHAFIDAIANAGADAVKFQTHIAAAESTPEEPWRIKFSIKMLPAMITGSVWNLQKISGSA